MLLCSGSYTMNWITDGKPSKEAITAFKLMTDLFNETFSDYKNMRCIVAPDSKNVSQSCAKFLSSQWKENPNYIIASHWKPFNDSVKDILQGNYVGSEMQPIPWKEGLKIYNNTINHAASVRLRESAVAFFNASNKKKNENKNND